MMRKFDWVALKAMFDIMLSEEKARGILPAERELLARLK